MQVINITNIPNQRVSISLDNNFYDITLKACGNVMACDIYINNVLIQQGIRLVPSLPLLNYPYLENGNFALITDNGDYPFYDQFGVTQYLVFMSNEEIAIIKSGGTVIASD